MKLDLPESAVIRVSRGDFEPSQIEDVERMTRETGAYLAPAIEKLPGLLSYFAAVSQSGSIVHVSIFADTHAGSR